LKNPQRVAQRRESILFAGVRVFAAKGYHSASVEDVLREAGISRATFYAHFASKEDLFNVIVDILLEAQSAFVLDLQAKFLTKSPNLISAIEEIINTMEQESKRSRDQLKIMLNEVQGSGTQAEKHFNQMQRVTLDHFTKLIQQQIESMGFSAAASRSLAYILIGGMMHLGKAILYGEMNKKEITQFLQGVKEILGDRGKIKSSSGSMESISQARRN